MQLSLSCVKPNIRRKRSVRVGRGIGSGIGKTSGRGHKGQRSRSGHSSKPGFEGGQTPFHRRIPKYGFRSVTRRTKQNINLFGLPNLSWCIGKTVKLLMERTRRLRENIRVTKLFSFASLNQKPWQFSG